MSLSSGLERLLTLWHQEMGFLDTKCSANAFFSDLWTTGTWGDLDSTQQTYLFAIQNNVLFTASSSQGINHEALHSFSKFSTIQKVFLSLFCYGIKIFYVLCYEEGCACVKFYVQIFPRYTSVLGIFCKFRLTDINIQ